MAEMAMTAHGAGPRNVGAVERELSVLGGAVLLMYGFSRKSATGLGVAALGGGLLVRGATGHCPIYETLGVDTARGDTQSVVRASRSERVTETITVNRRRSEVYDYWRDFENLPRFMENVVSIERLGDGRSHWKSKGPFGSEIEWDAEIINEVPGELIAWRTTDGFEVVHAGSVRFTEAAGGRGTVVKVELEYSPLGGIAGAKLAKWLGGDARSQIVEDLRRFKQVLEAGELATVEGQPAGAQRVTALSAEAGAR